MTNAELHYKKMTETPVAKLIISMGVPTTISMLITNIYNMADTYFVGTVGESAQAATGVMFSADHYPGCGLYAGPWQRQFPVQVPGR